MPPIYHSIKNQYATYFPIQKLEKKFSILTKNSKHTMQRASEGYNTEVLKNISRKIWTKNSKLSSKVLKFQFSIFDFSKSNHVEKNKKFYIFKFLF